MALGLIYALVAGLLWGLVFIVPLLLPQYPATLLSVGRYLAFGLVALPLAWLDRARLAQLTRADWVEALKLALVGNLLYYLALAAAIQRAGAPLPTMIIGTLPLVIAVSSNVLAGQGARLPWARLLPSLLLIAAGIALVNHAELDALRQQRPDADMAPYILGAGLAALAVICWTIYPIRNARWLRAHPDRSASTWATAQGVATLPLALVGYAVLWVSMAVTGADVMSSPASDGTAFAMPLGPTPERFVAWMLALGLLASWLGTLCWNEASQRLPTTLAGQLIVFETLAALAYALMLRGEPPAALTLAGAAVLIVGVLLGLRAARA